MKMKMKIENLKKSKLKTEIEDLILNLQYKSLPDLKWKF